MWRKDSNLRINLRETDSHKVEIAARHEFSHVLGNFDAYGYNQNRVGEFFFKGLEHKYLDNPGNKDNPHILDSVSATNVMDFLRDDVNAEVEDKVKVEDINIEMMLFAFSENRLQSFYPSVVGGTSQALYR